MLIVTAGSHHKDYDVTIKYCKKRCEQYGYKIKIYDLGSLGFGIPVDDPRLSTKYFTTRCAIKPELIRESVNETDEDFIAWIDGDATLIGRIDELEADTSFDIGITVRPKREFKKTHYMNAGVMFFKNNQRAKTFIDEWIAAFPPWPPIDATTKKLIRHYSDQNVIEENILLPNITVPFWDNYNAVYTVHGARVKLFEGAIYNNWAAVSRKPFYDPSIKIIHYKGRRRTPSKASAFEGQSMTHFEAYQKRFLDG